MGSGNGICVICEICMCYNPREFVILKWLNLRLKLIKSDKFK